MNRFQRFRHQRTADKNQQAEAQHNNAEKQLEAVNDAARSVRNLFVTYLLFSAYLGIIIAGTTHEQLLRVSPVILPLLNVEIPIKSFYIVAPLLYLLFHFNLLLQSWLLAKKYRELLALKPNQLLRNRLINFPLLQRLETQRGLMHWILRIIVTITYILLPISILLMAQRGFLPYHDTTITWIHRTTIFADICLLWLFIPKILRITQISRWRKTVTLSMHTLASTFVLIWTCIIMTIPDETVLSNPLDTTFDQIAKAIINNTKEYKKLTRYTLTKSTRETWPWLFNRNLDLREKILTRNTLTAETINQLRSGDPQQINTAQNKVLGINLRDRNLSYASLDSAILPKADLKRARVKNAYMREAQLQGANLDWAEFQNSNLRRAQLQNANLYRVKLQNADLRWAKLQNANLHRAELQGANLMSAKLQAVNLKEAKLQNTMLFGAELQGANLYQATLQGTNLMYGMLAGADLSKTKLQGATLRRAQLESAILDQATLQYTDLRNINTGTLSTELIGIVTHDFTKSHKKKLKFRFNKATSLRNTNSDKTCITSSLIADLNCTITGSRSSNVFGTTDYKDSLSDYLTQLACHSADNAKGIINYRLFFSDFLFADNKIFPKLAFKLEKKLKQDNCTGLKQLPDEFTQKIRDAAAQARQN